MGRYIESDCVDFRRGYEIFPDRKKPMLVIEEGNKGYAIAVFRSEENAKYFMVKLLDFVKKCQMGMQKKSRKG